MGAPGPRVVRLSNPRVHRVLLLMLGLVTIFYVRLQHSAVNSRLDENMRNTAARRLAQRISQDPVDALVGAEAPVHGSVRKAGMTALSNWHPAYAQLRITQFKAWLDQKGSLLSGSTAAGLTLMGVKPPYVLPFHEGRGCNIYYNERYKIIFLRTQKVASTTTMTFFGECAAEPDRPTCLKALDVEDALQLQLTWRNYFVFGWSRNPWARAVSSYQYLLHAVRDEPQCDRVDWDTFCQDPLVFGELCREHPECCPHFNHNFMWFHVNDQTTCLTTDSGEWAADFIGRSERFDEDFAAIVKAINQRLPPGVEPLSIEARPKSQNTNEVHCSDQLQRRPKRPAGEAEAEQPAAAGGGGAGGGGAVGEEPASAATEQNGVAAGDGAAAVEQSAANGGGGGLAADSAAASEEGGGSSGDQGAGDGTADGAALAAAGQEQQQDGALQEEQQQGGQQEWQEGGQQEEQRRGEQQGAAGRRRLLYGKLPGFLFAEENYCDKRKFYTGQHEACFQQIARFYSSDLQRLGYSKLLASDEGSGQESPVLALE